MAYVNTTRATQASVSDKVTGLFAGFSAALQRRRVYDQTIRELRALSDRDLHDLGLTRYMISDVARAAAYGK